MKMSTIVPFVFEDAAIKDNGEDSYCVIHLENGIVALGVFDGCGGIGGRRYQSMNNRKGAYIGSRVTASVFHNFIDNPKLKMDHTLPQKLEEAIFSRLNEVKLQITEANSITIGGNLVKSLPTTVSIILASEDNTTSLTCQYIWVGDSRGYILDSEGLCQVTVDDIDSNSDDAFINLREDGILTNVANGDKMFKLNQGRITIHNPAMLISATDGCFSYFLTPMDFEFVILEALIQSQTPEEWKQLLCQRIKAVTGDDYTLAIACFGFEDFSEMRKYYIERKDYIYDNYIMKESNLSDSELFVLWEKYKVSYYRMELKME